MITHKTLNALSKRPSDIDQWTNETVADLVKQQLDQEAVTGTLCDT